MVAIAVCVFVSMLGDMMDERTKNQIRELIALLKKAARYQALLGQEESSVQSAEHAKVLESILS